VVRRISQSLRATAGDEANTKIPSSNVGRADLALAQALEAAGEQDEADISQRLR